MGLLKNIFIILGVIVALLVLRMYHVAGKNEEPGGASGAFVEMPRPSNAPPVKVLLIGPEMCPKEAGVRIDRLERAIHTAGIPCARMSTVDFPTTSPSEGKRVEKLMSGELPIVFVGNLAKNNPSLEEIKAQFQRSRSQ